jgi:hypothetical protein
MGDSDQKLIPEHHNGEYQFIWRVQTSDEFLQGHKKNDYHKIVPLEFLEIEGLVG